jgi:hypothetical protein
MSLSQVSRIVDAIWVIGVIFDVIQVNWAWSINAIWSKTRSVKSAVVDTIQAKSAVVDTIQAKSAVVDTIRVKRAIVYAIRVEWASLMPSLSPCLLGFFILMSKRKKGWEMQKRKQQSTVWSPYLLLVSLVDAIRADVIPVNANHASPWLPDFFNVEEQKRVRDARAQKTIITVIVYEYR